jgi:hypothetical protein
MKKIGTIYTLKLPTCLKLLCALCAFLANFVVIGEREIEDPDKQSFVRMGRWGRLKKIGRYLLTTS